MGIHQDQQILSEQEQYFLNTLPLVRRIARRKLGIGSRDAAEDLVQKIGLNLWRWKSGKILDGEKTGDKDWEAENFIPENSHQNAADEKELTREEWLRLANRAAHNEVKSYYRQKYRRAEIFTESSGERESVVAEDTGEQSLTLSSPLKVEGNSRAEVASLLNRVWQIVETFPLKRKYSYLLGKEELIINLLTHGCATRKALAESLAMTAADFDKIIKSLPLGDEQIVELVENKTGEKVTLRQIWTWRAKAKRKLFAELKDQL